MHQAILRARHKYAWSPSEFREFVIASLFITLAFLIPRFLEKTHALAEWASLSLLYLLVTLLVVYGIIAVMKLIALAYGYEIEYKMSIILLAVGIYLSFMLEPIIPSAFLPWLFIGTFRARTDEKMRLGVWRPFRNQGDLARIVISGVLAAMILLLLMKGLWFASGSEIVRDFMVLVWMLGLCLLIPLPGNAGLEVFKSSIPIWFFVFIFVCAYGAISLLRQQGAFFTAVALAGVATWLFSKYSENR
jgi:hypothetical protein